MKSILCVLVMCLVIVSNAFSETTIRMPNGAVIPVDNLSDTDKSDLIRISKKMSVKEEAPMIDMKNVKPDDIKQWTALISGTIRDMCQDLNVAVNDFIKTPAGLGISALIIYKVAGKDIINRIYKMLVVPYWLLTSGILLFLGYYFFKPITVYSKIVQEDKKIIKSDPIRTTRYPWDTRKDGKPAFGFALIASFAVNTVVSLIIFFT